MLLSDCVRLYPVRKKPYTRLEAKIMLNIRIEDPEIEKNIRQTCGDDPDAIARAFFDFVKQQKIKQDIGISIEEIADGKGILLSEVIRDISGKYE